MGTAGSGGQEGYELKAGGEEAAARWQQSYQTPAVVGKAVAGGENLTSILALLVALVAFTLRVFQLGSQSLWHDEGASLYYATQAPAATIDFLARNGEMPPLYYLFLHYWLGLAGASEFALRFPSVVAGVLSIVLTYQLGRRLGGGAVGFAASLFLLAAPLHVWQSQEARMYTVLALLSLASMYVFLDLLRRPALLPLAGFALLSTAGLYTHFTFALVLLSQLVYLGLAVALAAQSRRTAWRITLAIGAAGVLYLPWLRVALLTYETVTTFWAGRLDVLRAGRETVAAFLQGELVQVVDPGLLALGGCALLAGGLAAAALSPAEGKTRTSSPALLLACWLLVPAATLALLLLDRPKYGPRYLLVIMPAFALLAGWATAALPAWLAGHLWPRRAASRAAHASPPAAGEPAANPAPARRWATTLGILVGSVGLALGLGCLAIGARALQVQLADPRLVREDFRGAAAYLARAAQADDAIILLGGHIQLPFLHYYRQAGGMAPVYPLPDSILPAVRRPLQRDDVEQLNAIVPGRRQVWMVRWQDELADPAGVILQQLELAGRRVDPGRAFAGLHLDAFAIAGTPRFPVSFQPQRAVDARFANGMTLVGFDLVPTSVRPSETLRLTLYWRADADVDDDYVAFTQLLNRGEHIYGQHDKPPVSELYPTSQWSAGDLLKDEYQLRVRPGTPPGTYRLQMGLYDRQSMRRVEVRAEPQAASANRLLLAEVAVELGEPLGPTADTMRQQVTLDVAPGMRLLGYEIEQDVLHPGDTARVALLWHATGPVDGERLVKLALRAADGREVAGVAAPPADGTYPTTVWRPNDLVRDVQNLPLPAELAPGRYTLVVAAPSHASGAAESLPLGSVEIK